MSVTACGTVSPRGHMSPSSTVDFGWFVAFGEHQNFSVFKIELIEIVILWVYFTIPFGFSLFGHFLVIAFQLFILHVWLMITDEGSVPEMRIWSISLIKSDQKWYIHLSRDLNLNLTLWKTHYIELLHFRCSKQFVPQKNKSLLILCVSSISLLRVFIVFRLMQLYLF